jgi:hypothetical protein
MYIHYAKATSGALQDHLPASVTGKVATPALESPKKKVQRGEDLRRKYVPERTNMERRVTRRREKKAVRCTVDKWDEK